MQTGTLHRAYINCPSCKTLHLVRRQEKHLLKSHPRFKCQECKCSWVPSNSEIDEIRNYYGFEKNKTREIETCENLVR